jgi:hypothetical protein
MLVATHWMWPAGGWPTQSTTTPNLTITSKSKNIKMILAGKGNMLLWTPAYTPSDGQTSGVHSTNPVLHPYRSCYVTVNKPVLSYLSLCLLLHYLHWKSQWSENIWNGNLNAAEVTLPPCVGIHEHFVGGWNPQGLTAWLIKPVFWSIFVTIVCPEMEFVKLGVWSFSKSRLAVVGGRAFFAHSHPRARSKKIVREREEKVARKKWRLWVWNKKRKFCVFPPFVTPHWKSGSREKQGFK